MTVITWEEMGYESKEDYEAKMKGKQENKQRRATGETGKRAPSKYNLCISQFFKMNKGKITKENRSSIFCLAAKLCSGKASETKEAANLCKIDWDKLPALQAIPVAERSKEGSGLLS